MLLKRAKPKESNSNQKANSRTKKEKPAVGLADLLFVSKRKEKKRKRLLTQAPFLRNISTGIGFLLNPAPLKDALLQLL